MRRLAVPLAALCALVAGCGSSGKSTKTVVVTAPTATVVDTTATHAPTTPAAKRSLRPGNYPATLTIQSSAPKVNAPWKYSVTAKTKTGAPLGGTVRVEVVKNGKVINTIGWYGFDGSFSSSTRWPPQVKGQALVFRVEVITAEGKRVLDRSVRVR